MTDHSTSFTRSAASAPIVVEPRDPAIFGDGRPVQEGASIRSLDLPWPSSFAGLLRTRAGLQPNGDFSLSHAQARALEARGPWVVELDAAGKVIQTWLPAPADAVLYQTGTAKTPHYVCHRLSPAAHPDGVVTDIHSEGHADSLKPLYFNTDPGPAKAHPMPRLWSWTRLQAWLTAPSGHGDFALDTDGLDITREKRVHVALDPQNGTAEDGKLFSTDGVRFTVRMKDKRIRRFALAGAFARALPEGPCVLGGERRLAHLRAADGIAPLSPPNAAPSSDGLVRVILATPGYFTTGSLPTHIAGAKVIAAAVGRPIVASGWSFEHNGPKPSRRLVPAGSVFWVRLPESVKAEDWRKEVWMNSISDSEQERRDGFGLALVGVP